VIISESSSSLPAALNMGNSANGPTVAMRANPSDPYGKVLIITADDGEGVVKAAQAVATAPNILHGDTTPITSLTLPNASKPDDAPRWLSTDHDTLLKDITQQETMQGDGSVPIGVYLRVPPDLYLPSPDANRSFHVNYRYNGMPLADSSTLQIYFNNGYISSTPLPHTTTATTNKEEVVPVPVVDLRPFSNSVLMKFFFQIAKKNECQDTAPLNQQGAILGNSYIDLKGIPHWAVMPNLEIFANAGFPFTRLADLSQTTVVMPDKPANEEIEMLLPLMGHFGAQTGMPALRLTVANADAMHAGANEDFLVLGTVNDQPALGKLSGSLPVTLDTNGVHVKDTQGFFAQQEHAWWKVRPSEHITSGDLQTAGSLPDTMIEGIESPYKPGRSIVLIAVKDTTTVNQFLTAFLKSSQSSDIANTVSVLHGNRFDSFRIGSSYYHIGYINPWVALSLWFQNYPWLLVLGVVLTCVLMAVWLRVFLRRRARRRLGGRED
jgi:cellulose synthase (UDP-forming)